MKSDILFKEAFISDCVGQSVDKAVSQKCNSWKWQHWKQLELDNNPRFWQHSNNHEVQNQWVSSIHQRDLDDQLYLGVFLWIWRGLCSFFSDQTREIEKVGSIKRHEKWFVRENRIQGNVMSNKHCKKLVDKLTINWVSPSPDPASVHFLVNFILKAAVIQFSLFQTWLPAHLLPSLIITYSCLQIRWKLIR